MRTLKYLLLLLIAPFCFSQTSTTVEPNCSLGFTFTATGTSPVFDNTSKACPYWTLTVYNVGFSAFSITLQSAPAASKTTPSTFVTYIGTTATGANPVISNSVSTFTNGTAATPFLRLNLTTVTGTGTLFGVLQGWNSNTARNGGGGGGGGPNILGTANQITATGPGCTSPSTSNCTIAIANNPILPGVATAGGFVSNEAASGNLQLNGLTSGNVTFTVADVAGTAVALIWPADTVANGSGKVIGDSGVTTCPTLPAGAPAVCHQLIWTTGGGGSAGGGVLGFSASILTLPTAGTTFLAPVGGAAASATEATVTANAPAAAAISNMYVTLSAPPGTGNTIAFTFRDAGSSTALTCTISGNSATSCQDTTHTFTPVIGDALAIQVVTTGTVVITPSIKVIAEYGVTGGGGGTTVLPAPPYITVGASDFVAYNMYQATKPTAPTYLNAATCTSSSTGANGDFILANSTGIQCFGGYVATTSVEVDFSFIATGNGAAAAGVWLWDSTNNTIYTWQVIGNGGGLELALYQWSYNGSGNPSFSSQLFTTTSATMPAHLKMSVSGGTLTLAVSQNGGVTSSPITTVGSIGTISQGGFILDLVGILDIYSLVVL